MAGNKSSGRPGIIDNHPEKKTIIKQLVLGKPPATQIAKRLGMHVDSVRRYKAEKITPEMRAKVFAENRIAEVEKDVAVINEDRMDVANTYESLAKRVDRLLSKAEENDDDAFTLAAAEGLRKVLRDIATLQGKMAQSVSVTVTLAQSPEWLTLRRILMEVCAEVPAAREPLLRKMRHEVLSVTKEPDHAL